MPNEEEIKKEIEVKLDEPLSEKEIEIKPNALETLTQTFDKEELGNNLLSKGVDNIEEFKRNYGYGQGLDKSLQIISETIEKYKKGEIEDDE